MTERQIPVFTFREITNRRIPGTFPPTLNPIDDATINRGIVMFREKMGLWRKKNFRQPPTKYQLFEVLDEVIIALWGKLNLIPNHEYMYLRAEILAGYRNVKSMKFGFSKLPAKDRLTIGPDTSKKKVIDLKIARIEERARLVFPLFSNPDPQERWAAAINEAMRKLRRQLKIKFKEEAHIFQEVMQRVLSPKPELP